MKELTILLVCIIAIFIYTNYIRKSLYLSPITSSINSKEYYVRNLPDKEIAADKLAELSVKLTTLTDSVDSKEKKVGIERLQKYFKSDKISENIPGSLYVAYSVNKGEELSICIREKDTEKFIDDNTITFVAVHELAHIMSESTGHTEEFWSNMKYLLEEGSKLGIYRAVDYSQDPTIYCGMEINSTPLNL
tara:strand:+ start:157 stop:729 length:573 start_codon:yes stop_codon:yes gene_type:complete